ncbi:MAG TPA: roadblock/LC7 domain-containing protein [Longimicrobiales bacterium]|nr:roadblock/LC7 domain-containing protein [Longimicrobiales bacterium]
MTSHAIPSLGGSDMDRVRSLLRDLVDGSGARCALLLDRAGRAVTAVGKTDGIDETSFASLAAADFDASDQLAALLGEQEFTALYHQGADGSMYLSDIAGTAILAAVFDQRTTLGMVRLKTRAVLPRLADLMESIGRRGAQDDEELEEGWLDEAVGEIDRLFAG